METVMFSFDGLDILSAIKNDVIIRGTTDFDDNECVIVISRGQFNKSLKEWLDAKLSYYNLWKEFCGAGYVECIVIEELNEYQILDLSNIDEDAVEYKTVKAYRCNFDCVQMEHG